LKILNPHQNGKMARLPKRLGRGAWIGGGAEPPGTRGAAARCEGREFARPVPFAVLLNQEEFRLTPGTGKFGNLRYQLRRPSTSSRTSDLAA
jgi:hypothetical protein